MIPFTCLSQDSSRGRLAVTCHYLYAVAWTSSLSLSIRLGSICCTYYQMRSFHFLR